MAEGKEAHWEVVERILFLYAKLNPGQGYVQGMNEIIGPIYHAFASDPDIRFRGKYFQIIEYLLLYFFNFQNMRNTIVFSALRILCQKLETFSSKAWTNQTKESTK